MAARATISPIVITILSATVHYAFYKLVIFFIHMVMNTIYFILNYLFSSISSTLSFTKMQLLKQQADSSLPRNKDLSVLQNLPELQELTNLPDRPNMTDIMPNRTEDASDN